MRNVTRTLMIATLVCAGTAAAHADSFTFAATGSGSPSFTLTGGTLTGTSIGNDEYVLTSITGTINGAAVSIIPTSNAAVNNAAVFLYDNDFFTSGAPLDEYGIAFTDGSTDYNVYDLNGVLQYNTTPAATPGLQGAFGNGLITSFAGTPTPEPSSLLLLGTAMTVGAGIIRRRIVRS